MKKVWIAPGCITCGRCEFIAPEIFEVLDIAYVKKDADILKNEKLIQEAVATCPVNVIHYNSTDKSSDKSA
ncbi:MAG TPA: ferredoxin [Candidatus Saccharimonadales bacterium]|nr:ferredoxin [Candidatus Saccharimonadales bacterium]